MNVPIGDLLRMSEPTRSTTPSALPATVRPARDCGVSEHDLVLYAAIAGSEPLIDSSLKEDHPVLSLRRSTTQSSTASVPQVSRGWSPRTLCDELRKTVHDSVSRQVRRPEIADFIRRLTESTTHQTSGVRFVRSRIADGKTANGRAA